MLHLYTCVKGVKTLESASVLDGEVMRRSLETAEKRIDHLTEVTNLNQHFLHMQHSLVNKLSDGACMFVKPYDLLLLGPQ